MTTLDDFARRVRAAQAAVDAQIAQTAAALPDAFVAFARTHGPMELVLRAETVLEIASALQLAKRHPDLGAHPTILAAIERYLTAAREYFTDCPPMIEALRQGDDPRFDR